MAEMVCSALVQETVSRGVSFVLGKREEKASQGHLMEKLEMEVNRLEFALERAQYLPISHLSLISRRKMIESAYVEAMKLLNKQQQQQQQAVPPAPGQELQVAAQGVKRKRWFFWDKDMPITKPSDVRRFQSYADYADKFEGRAVWLFTLSLQLLHQPSYCQPSPCKALVYSHWELGNLQRIVAMCPMDCDERGREAAVSYHYLHYDDSTMTEKSFSLGLFLRLSESTDIAGVAMKGLQLLTSEFKLAAESASGELTMLYTSQDIAHSYWPRCVVKDLWVDIQHSYWPPYVVKDLCVDIQEAHSKHAQIFAQTRHVAKELGLDFVLATTSHQSYYQTFPEQVLLGGFHCYYYVPPPLEAEPSSRSSSSSPPLLLTADFQFMPHRATETQESYAVETIGDVEEYRYASSIQQVVEAIKSNAINCFLRQPELTRYGIDWYSKHGFAGFWVKKESMERSILEELQGE